MITLNSLKMIIRIILFILCPLFSYSQSGTTPTRTGVPVNTSPSASEQLKFGVQGDSVVTIRPVVNPEKYTPSDRSIKVSPSGKKDTTKVSQEAYGLYAGLNVAMRAGVNTNVPTGTKTDVDFASSPDYGLSILIPFNRTASLGLGLDVGYTNYAYISKPESGATDNNSIRCQYTYFNIFPHFYLSGFVIGASLTSSPTVDFSYKNGTKITTITNSNLVSNIEAKLGFAIPVMDESFGRLNVNFLAGYTVNGLYDTKYIVNSDDNPQVVSVGLGISFLFKVPLAN